MRAFVYVGAEGETDAFGFRFPRGEPVEVDEKAHPHAVKKLAANQWFREVEPVEDAVIVKESEDQEPGGTEAEPGDTPRRGPGRPKKG